MAEADVFDLWALTYDSELNPLLRLEERLLPGVLGDVSGLRVLDAGCGTGRWIERLSARGARVCGFDRSREMLHRGPRGRTVQGALERPPFLADAADLVLASFSLSYETASVGRAGALVRPPGRVVVSDWHPEADGAGWKRGFRTRGRSLEPAWRRLEDDALPGFELERRVEAEFGEPERVWFERAGKRLEDALGVKALEIRVWRRRAA